jgi:mRNA interferase HigB
LRVIAKRTLQTYWSRHPKTKAPLSAWHKTVRRADWSNPQEVRDTYRSADPIGEEFVVFDICDNEYRLVVRVDYERGIVYIWDVYTHSEYDRINFKAIDEKIRREKKRRKRL